MECLEVWAELEAQAAPEELLYTDLRAYTAAEAAREAPDTGLAVGP